MCAVRRKFGKFPRVCLVLPDLEGGWVGGGWVALLDHWDGHELLSQSAGSGAGWLACRESEQLARHGLTKT